MADASYLTGAVDCNEGDPDCGPKIECDKLMSVKSAALPATITYTRNTGVYVIFTGWNDFILNGDTSTPPACYMYECKVVYVSGVSMAGCITSAHVTG